MAKDNREIVDYVSNVRTTTTIIGWIQIIFNIVFFLTFCYILIQLFNMDMTQRSQLKMHIPISFVPDFKYEDVVIYSMILTTNSVVAAICGFFLVNAVKENRSDLLVLWTVCTIAIWFGNTLAICVTSFTLAVVYTILYLAICIIPLRVVVAFEAELDGMKKRPCAGMSIELLGNLVAYEEE